MRRVNVLVTAAGMMMFAVVSGNARKPLPPQMSSTTTQQAQHPSVLNQDNEAPDPFKDHMQEQAARARNSERHKRMVADTEKLLQLSTELKAEVDKTTKDEMSVQVIQKAAEIEKLARDVKDRMKG